ncbi:Spy/CpxP family protein refolding chaperone [Undibacterium sp.]|jgi:protein CpxP|uniref:Spy/CpxP family protein refolding chaperone n=1 Tax=Undibacterium sp. TaxID=1914977 RepID=UPI002B95ADAA|nr:Spy/CpxP family protein refolding chaperone [Undibacterium sp.]HTD02455.1 Spy/CpxP family protein refolding chaperone [Undibacterium sp.]
MNEPDNVDNKADVSQPSRSGRRWMVAAAIAGVVSVLSITGISYARDGMGRGCHHGWGMHHDVTPEAMSKHVDAMVNHILADGTQEQKTKVADIAKAAFKDLYPLRQQHQAAHQQAVKLLTQPTIDRAALEQVRADEMRLADQVSRRITQAVADAAEVLTPEQRIKLAEHMKKRMG